VSEHGAGIAITVYPATVDGLIELGCLDPARRDKFSAVALAVTLLVAVDRALRHRHLSIRHHEHDAEADAITQ
jgi:hypothetical protein